MLGGGASSAVAADNCANAEFRVGPSALLPDCRAYELVTPAEKTAYTLTVPGSPLIFPSESGDQALFMTLTPLPGALNGHISTFVGTRETDGWKPRPMTPAICSTDQSGFPQVGDSWTSKGWSLDFSVSVPQAAETNNCDPNDHDGADLYRFDGTSTTWLSHNGVPKTSTATAALQATSADASHVVFSTPEALVMPLEIGRAFGQGLYERVGDQLRVVGLKADGSLINPCGARIAGDGGSNGDTIGTISGDGRVIFFNSGVNNGVAGCSTVTDDAGQLYARIDGSRTAMISASQRTVADTRRQPELMGASRDGRTAYFMSTEMLTDDATTGGGLYAYDLGPVVDGTATSGTLRFLTPALTAAAANIQGRQLAGMSDDGSRIYFVANGVLAPGAPASGRKLYAYDRGQIRLVGPYVGNNFNPAVSVSVSADGSKAVGLHRPAGYTTDQVFLYDLADLSVTCVSCVAGVTPAGHASLQSQLRRPADLAPRRNVTNDGMVFFESVDRLVARDTNDKSDVYRYANGELRLISGGTGSMGSFLAGATASGRDVFFVTNDSLLPEDFDNGDQDLYVARIGGGFSQPTGDEAPCVGDACQGGVDGTPGVLLPGTAGFVGAGNIPAPPAQKKGDSASTKVSLVKGSRTVRGSSGHVRVRVSGEGTVRTSGSGLRRSSRTVKRSGTAYRIPVRLSSRAKRTLNRRGRVQVRVTVRFTPEAGKTRSTRVRMTFRKAKSSSRSKESRSGERAVSVAVASDGKGGR
ncbi:MAG: hypothetical protein ITG02_07755 [Patulibacter sp.]|nr:hypothetical protein [Patulibacter sp.]